MTTVVVLAACIGVGVLGVAFGIRRPHLSLDGVLQTWERQVVPGTAPTTTGRPTTAGSTAMAVVLRSRWSGHPWVGTLLADLDLTGTDPEAFATRLLAVIGTSALAPLILWLLADMAGVAVPVVVAGIFLVGAVPLGATLPVLSLVRQATERRRHFRVVTGSFVDLVVLSLAGGVGIDGALHAAAGVSPDWAAQRMGRALSTARDGGTTPWAALEALGRELRVPELVELATTVQLAGTEGARIRQSLTARAASLRRHEQAEAESAANAMTERLFLPGALLLLGFLLFIGFPAVHRILGGF
jgi:Flp pilus assembly protein TadB